MGIQSTLRALSDPVRRSILKLLKSGRMSAGEIVEQFDITGAAISRHLSVLKDADLIRDTREGKYIYYAPMKKAPKTSPLSVGILRKRSQSTPEFHLE